MVIIIYAFVLMAAICLGKVLEKCLNLRMTKQGEPWLFRTKLSVGMTGLSNKKQPPLLPPTYKSKSNKNSID